MSAAAGAAGTRCEGLVMTERAAHLDGTAIALVGIGCRFPGGVANPAEFWSLIERGGDAITEIPPDRIDLAHFFDERPATPGRIMTRWGGFLPDIDKFDAGFFGISPREAERLDPAQRLVLETAWESLEDAGIDTKRLDGSPTGVFVGQWLSDFEARLFADPEAVDFYMTTGSGRYATSGRLSYLLGLRGPSLTVDTACSSSLVAVHLAVRSLRAGECTLALAGGVNIILQPHISVAYSQSRMMAPDGRCKFCDARGDGYVRSEGAGIVVLKPLDRALADGDRVYAVIRGSAVNNDGHSSGSMGTPSREGQEALLRSAYADACVSPGHVGYVEAHGTGTRAGDPVELGALGAVLAEGRATGERARVGSVKTNFGHTEGAAGVAGLIKVALAIHHGRIPASLHCRELNPTVDWAAAPFEVARQSVDWSAPLRLGGVSAFGIAGTNAHLVLEAAPASALLARPVALPVRPALLLLSARSREALQALAASCAERLAGANRADLDAMCWAMATRRSALEHRAAFVAGDAETLATRLRAFAGGESATAEGTVHAAPALAPVFVAPGQGGQWPGMARELMAREPEFRQALQACDDAARPWLDASIIEQLQLDPGVRAYRLERIELIQPVLVAVAIACGRWLQSLGIEPSAVVGHSMGEVAAAHLAGALDLDQAMRIICRRSALMGRTSGRGAMAMVDLPMAEAEQRLAGREALLSVAVSNSPRSCVVSGAPAALQTWMAELESAGVFCRLVKVDVASHSPQMDGPAVELARELAGLAPGDTVVPLHSTVLARAAIGTELDAAYWGRNMRQPVRFADTVAGLLDAGARSFVELGLHPVLTVAVQQTAQARNLEVSALVAGRRDEPEHANTLALLGALWAAGHAIDWGRVLPAAGPIALPTYPWQRERLWVRQADQAAGDRRPQVDCLPLEQQAWLHALRWVHADSAPVTAPATAEPWLLVAADDPAIQTTIRVFATHGTLAAACTPAALGATLAASHFAGVVLLLPDVPGVAYQPVAALQSLADSANAGSARLWLATIGAQAVDGHARPRVAVHAGAAWGAGRVIADEHPDLWGGMVDLDPFATTEARAETLVRVLRIGNDEPQVAWRDGQRHVLRLQPLCELPVEAAPLPWRAGAAYLVTGGLGDVGLQVAAGMVARGARRLVLMGRHGLPPRERWRSGSLDAGTARRVAAVLALEAAGAAVHVLEVDLASAADTERALRGYEAAAWPPIRGVVHAAGVLESQLSLQADPGSFTRVLAPKLDGALCLDRLLPELDCFIMFSSIIAVLGVAGTAAYAAANAGLDALATDRRARGLPAQSIQWGAWEGLGMLGGDAGRSHMEGLRALGVQGFSALDGCRLLNALAGRPEVSLAVMAMDWPALRAARRAHALTLIRGRHDTGGGNESQGSLSQRLASLGTAERRTVLEPVVREAVGRVLKIAPQRIDAARPLGSMGLNSLMAMELRNRLEVALGRPLSATLAWNYPNIDALVGFLCGDTDEALSSAAPAPAPSAAVSAIAELSDEEAAQMLRRRR